MGHLGDTVQNLFRIHTDYNRGPGNLLGGGTLLLGPAEIALVLLDLASQKFGCLGVDLPSNELSQLEEAQGRRVPIYAHQSCRKAGRRAANEKLDQLNLDTSESRPC